MLRAVIRVTGNSGWEKESRDRLFPEGDSICEADFCNVSRNVFSLSIDEK